MGHLARMQTLPFFTTFFPPFSLIFSQRFCRLFSRHVGVLRPYFPGLGNDNVERDERIECYFIVGLGYDEILLLGGFIDRLGE